MNRPLVEMLRKLKHGNEYDEDAAGVDWEPFEKLRLIAIELAKACEEMTGGSVCRSSETTCGKAIARAKDILGAK